MNIITLTTDLGLKDHYAAVLKGKILRKFPEAQFIDVTHLVEPFDVQQAAHVLGASWRNFPNGTVHAVAVNMQHTAQLRCIFFAYKGHYFAGPDNGVFPLALGELPRDIFGIPLSGNIMDDLAEAAAGLADGAPLMEIGTLTGNVLILQNILPPVNDHMIKTNVAYIDHFGNVVLAINKEDFEIRRRNRSMDMEFGKREHISKVSESYADVHEGEKLCLFNDSGFLEIAINKGNAHELLGLKINDTILIEFS